MIDIMGFSCSPDYGEFFGTEVFKGLLESSVRERRPLDSLWRSNLDRKVGVGLDETAPSKRAARATWGRD
jgi:hypothetical protein